MDGPKTRRENKKDQREKGSGKDGKYSAKHIRNIELLRSNGKNGSVKVKDINH
jgi:hypothetical protein